MPGCHNLVARLSQPSGTTWPHGCHYLVKTLLFLYGSVYYRLLFHRCLEGCYKQVKHNYVWRLKRADGALIVLTLNANMNEPNLHVPVLRKLISLSYILRAKRVVSICSSTTTMHSYLHRQFAEYLLHCINLPGMFDGPKTASKIQMKILFVNVSKYQSYNTTYICYAPEL